ncbi:MAG: hypothetical protein CMP83_11725 [Gammaproteobacteria bacterium]|nr:hypothetical protein [Gammaproteobacteria bacterium]
MTEHNDDLGGLNYERLVEDSLRNVVREALRIAQTEGLPGETHFYVAFDTRFPGVIMEDDLRSKHPESITIVIQHQFADLAVQDDHFRITLYFNGKPSSMTVPFAAVTSFNDPSVGFGLQFEPDETMLDETVDPENVPTADEAEADPQAGGSADVVSLDSFRKPS